MKQNFFSTLTPDIIIDCAESFSGLRFDGTIVPYNSYVNRVFGLTADDGSEYVIKFYRPGRWTREGIEEEHTFLSDCVQSEVPAVPPLGDQTQTGETVGTFNAGGLPVYYALFARLRARTFDIYTEEDWIRTGRAVARMHLAGQKRTAPHRLQCTPQQTTIPYINALLEQNLVTPVLQREFTGVCSSALDYVLDAYASVFGEADENGIYDNAGFSRIHGDCHRGNILEHGATAESSVSSITFIDFDDMMNGPAVQDLWLLLPGYKSGSEREIELLLNGYEEFIRPDETQVCAGSCFSPPDVRRQLRLVEPLRFMRMIYFLSWTAAQYNDEGFSARYPEWGCKAFWETEIEDLRTQLSVLEDEYSQAAR
jgi:Putative homoserine kinase type II (protein kinase fold)